MALLKTLIQREQTIPYTRISSTLYHMQTFSRSLLVDLMDGMHSSMIRDGGSDVGSVGTKGSLPYSAMVCIV